MSYPIAKQTLASEPAQIGQVAAIIAHHVRNPLAGISGALCILRDRLTLHADDHAIMREILERIAKLNENIEEIRAFGRPIAPKPQTVSAWLLLEEATTTVSQTQFPHANIQLPRRDIAIFGDPVLLKQAICCVLVNALESTHGVGTVSIFVSQVGPKDAPKCEIAITDSGPGHSQDNIEKLFEPFFTTKSQHVGLGLNRCRRMLRAQNGDIVCRSSNSNGTTFVITVPVAPPEPFRNE